MPKHLPPSGEYSSHIQFRAAAAAEGEKMCPAARSAAASLDSVKEASIPEQRLLSNGSSFPAVIVPASSSAAASASNSIDSLKQGMPRVEACLAKCGAVLLRGFSLRTASDFDDFVGLLGRQEFPYSIGGEATRSRVTGRVFTANDGIPLDKPIGFHNEVAYLLNSPSRIIFFCETPPPHKSCGGSTLIAHGRGIYEAMLAKGQRRFLDDLKAKQVRYSKILAAQGPGSWQSMFKTTKQQEAQQRARNIEAQLEWLDGGSAIFHSSPCPGIKVDPSTGEDVWFNTVHGIQVFKSISPPGSFDARFGDGSPFPQEAVAACMEAVDEQKLAFHWQRGDILLLDNTRVLHARQPSSQPRTVLVSLCK